MTWPYAVLANNKTDATVTPTDHASHHNALANALNDILTAFGTGGSPQFGTLALGGTLSTADAGTANSFAITDTKTVASTGGNTVETAAIQSKITVSGASTGGNLKGLQLTMEPSVQGFTGDIWAMNISGNTAVAASATLNSLQGLVIGPTVAGGSGSTTTRTIGVNIAPVAAGGTVTDAIDVLAGHTAFGGTITRAHGFTIQNSLAAFPAAGAGVDLGGYNGWSIVGRDNGAGGGLPMSHHGYVILGQASNWPFMPAALPTALLHLNETGTITGAVTDGYTSAIRAQPVINGAFTVTRHNYLDILNPTGTSTITDAAVMRFDAAAGTHKAVAANGTVATTITSLGPTGAQTTIQGWLKVNVAGTLRYIPFW